jgi:hypothetical protein
LRVPLLWDDDPHLSWLVLLQPQHLELLARQRRKARRKVAVVVTLAVTLYFRVLWRKKMMRFLFLSCKKLIEQLNLKWIKLENEKNNCSNKDKSKERKSWRNIWYKPNGISLIVYRNIFKNVDQN